MNPRARIPFEQRVALYAAFARHVAALDDGAWQRIIVRCALFDGPSVFALIARALLSATPHEFATDGVRKSPLWPVKIIAHANSFAQTSLALVYEISQEFDAFADTPPTRRRVSTGRPHTDQYIDANYDMNTALFPRQRLHSGLRAAVRAAGQAVLFHGLLSPEHFEQCYAVLEPEIPFRELEIV